jgi:cysteine desulfurase family protein
MQPSRIYLDNAATSWPKPEPVYEAVERYQRENGAPAGRSVYAEAQQVERAVEATRALAAGILGGVPAHSVVFTTNGTDSLNLAIHGLVRPNDHVVTTRLEHNSVLRPLRFLEQRCDVRVSRVSCGSDTVIDVDELFADVGPTTRLIVLTHMSNVTGSVQDAQEVCRRAAERGLPCLIDAAQSAGHQRLEFAECPTTLVATPGHKGLMGPLGIGLLSIPEALQTELAPQRQGGTGTKSESDEQPIGLPDRFESGNHNVPAILGLGAGIRWLNELGADEARRRLDARRDELVAGLSAIEGVTLLGTLDPRQRGAVVAFRVAGFSPQEVAGMLDSSHRVQARAGFLCAPLVHSLIGAGTGGVIRLSPGLLNSEDDTKKAVEAVAEIAECGRATV